MTDKYLYGERLLQFSWSQLVELVRMDDPWKRAFYENECLKASWSVRQLQRQIGSMLYERTGLSSDKAAVIEDARRQVMESSETRPLVCSYAAARTRPRSSTPRQEWIDNSSFRAIWSPCLPPNNCGPSSRPTAPPLSQAVLPLPPHRRTIHETNPDSGLPARRAGP